MNNPKLYSIANQVQRNDAIMVIREFGNLLKWRSDGKDRILDVGCGSCDILMEIVEPFLPQNYEKLVASDISMKMLNFAEAAYGKSHPKLEFDQLDIVDDCMPNKYLEYFDHIMSSYCLHWVKDLEKAFTNIGSLVAEGGDCLLDFVACNPVFSAYKIMSSTEKWAPYMKDVDKYISPLHFCNNPGEEVNRSMSNAGFKSYNVQVKERSFVYKGTQIMRDNMTAVNPFLKRLPSEKFQSEFIDDFLQAFVDMGLTERSPNDPQDLWFTTPYKLIVIYAKK